MPSDWTSSNEPLVEELKANYYIIISLDGCQVIEKAHINL
jgi:hypothetical protein